MLSLLTGLLLPCEGVKSCSILVNLRAMFLSRGFTCIIFNTENTRQRLAGKNHLTEKSPYAGMFI